MFGGRASISPNVATEVVRRLVRAVSQYEAGTYPTVDLAADELFTTQWGPQLIPILLSEYFSAPAGRRDGLIAVAETLGRLSGQQFARFPLRAKCAAYEKGDKYAGLEVAVTLLRRLFSVRSHRGLDKIPAPSWIRSSVDTLITMVSCSAAESQAALRCLDRMSRYTDWQAS